MQETRVQPLGWEDPLEKGMATHSSILAWSPWGRKELDAFITFILLQTLLPPERLWLSNCVCSDSSAS